MEQQTAKTWNWKNVAMIVGAIIIILFLIKCNSDRQTISQFKNEKKVDTLYIKTWKDKYNQEHTKVAQNEINFANLITAKSGEIAILRNDIAEDKSIIGKLIIRSRTNQKIVAEVKTVPIDSTDNIDKKDYAGIVPTTKQTFEFCDDFLWLDGKIIEDKATITYSLREDFDVFQKVKENGFFKRNTIDVELVSKNPNSSTQKFQVFVIQQPPKKWWETRATTFVAGAVFGIWAESRLNK